VVAALDSLANRGVWSFLVFRQRGRYRLWLHRKKRRVDRNQKGSGLWRAAIHGETRTKARARVRRFRKLPLECRDVFSGESPFPGNLKRFLPKTHTALEKLAEFIGTRSYERKLRAIYSKLENISVDYAVLEPATRVEGPSRVFVIPAEVGWSDIGSWAAVYQLLAKNRGENVLAAEVSRSMQKAIFCGARLIRGCDWRP